MNYEIGASQRGPEPWKAEAEDGCYDVGSRYQATTGEYTADWEDLVRAVVYRIMCESAMAM
jgi:hypothetical protein